MNKFRTLIAWIAQRAFRHKDNNFPESDHIIKEAFTLNGTAYYQFDDVFNVPYQRGLSALGIFEEMRMKCTLEYLKMHTEAVKNLLSGNKIGLKEISKINELNEQLAFRLKWVVDTDLVYKLASVVYFDASEKPEVYEEKYSYYKIQKWKQEASAHDFFLQLPLRTLIPFLNDSEVSSPDYLKAVEEMTKGHLANIWQSLSEKQKQDFKDKLSPSYVTEILQGLS